MVQKFPKEKKSIRLILEQYDASPHDLRRLTGLSLSYIHRALRELMEEGFIEKIGATPHIYYRRASVSDAQPFPTELKVHDGDARLDTLDAFIEEHFLWEDEDHTFRYGIEGFEKWSEQALKKYSLEEKKKMYKEQMDALERKKVNGVFDLTEKLQSLIKDIGDTPCIEYVHTLAHQTLPDFGRTKEMILLDAAKLTGSKKDVAALIDCIKKRLCGYVRWEKPSAVLIISPTKQRKVQVMYELEKILPAKLPRISVKRKFAGKAREQKMIKSLEARLVNARNSFYIPTQQKAYKKILIIDDLLGSGATLHQVAKELAKQVEADTITALTVVGREKGYTTVRQS